MTEGQTMRIAGTVDERFGMTTLNLQSFVALADSTKTGPVATDLFAVDAGQLLDFIITKEFDGGISVHMKILGPLVDSASHDFRDFVHRNIRHSVLVIDR